MAGCQGLSDYQAGEKLDCSHQTIYNWRRKARERGQRTTNGSTIPPATKAWEDCTTEEKFTMLAVFDDMRCDEVGPLLGVHAQTIRNWRSRARRQGLNGSLQTPARAPRRQANGSTLQMHTLARAHTVLSELSNILAHNDEVSVVDPEGKRVKDFRGFKVLLRSVTEEREIRHD